MIPPLGTLDKCFINEILSGTRIDIRAQEEKGKPEVRFWIKHQVPNLVPLPDFRFRSLIVGPQALKSDNFFIMIEESGLGRTIWEHKAKKSVNVLGLEC